MRFLRSSVFDLGFGGAWGGTKTESLIMGGVRYADRPGMRTLILRNTYPQLQQIIDRTHDLFPQMGGKWSEQNKRWEFPAGGVYRFGYGSNMKEIRQYLSDEYTYIGIDQAEQIEDESVLDLLMGRIRSKHPDLTLMFRVTFNPGGPGHGFCQRRYVKPCPWDGTPIVLPNGITRGFIFSTFKDNPTLLENDPTYEKRLEALPEHLRKQALGDWSAGEGVAFPNLTETSHLEVIQPEGWWTHFGAFDWGYGHKWSFGLFANIGQNRVRLVDSAGGRQHTPLEIAERVADMLQAHELTFANLKYTVAGADVKIRDEARGAYGPSVMEQFLAIGWALMRADQSRIAGYQNMLAYVGKPHSGRPLLSVAPTANNKLGIAQMMGLALDPDNPNDVLKVDYDPERNEGGDDFYDMLRYGLMSRPLNVEKQIVRLPGVDDYRATRKPDRQSVPSAPRWTMPHQLTRSVEV